MGCLPSGTVSRRQPVPPPRVAGTPAPPSHGFWPVLVMTTVTSTAMLTSTMGSTLVHSPAVQDVTPHLYAEPRPFRHGGYAVRDGNWLDQ